MTVAPARSAQTDRYVHDRLPPDDQWPQLVYNLPELQFPPQLNLVARLLDEAVHTRGWGSRPLLRSDDRLLTYAQALDEVNRMAHLLIDELGLEPGNRTAARRQLHQHGPGLARSGQSRAGGRGHHVVAARQRVG